LRTCYAFYSDASRGTSWRCQCLRAWPDCCRVFLATGWFAWPCGKIAESAEAMIWATGYRSDYAWIDILGVAHDGKVAHQRGTTNVPGLYFLGLPWQHARGSALLGFVHHDAACLDGLIASTT
jgi:hypothetical protein